jgi:hypothetical protein
MLKLLFINLIIIFFSGCLNERGISSKYYDECREYYDVQGTYHKVCPKNMVEFEEMRQEFEQITNPNTTLEMPQERGNVY